MPKLQIIKEILDERNIPVAEFCKEINLSVSGFKRIIDKNSTRLQTLEKIAQVLNCPVGIFFNETTEKIKEKRDIRIPHIPFSAQAGTLSGISDGVSEAGCEMNSKITALGNYDFTIDVKGDSMTPEFQSGDVIACKMLQPGDSLRFGAIYLIDSAQGIVLKKIDKNKPDESLIQCLSLNPAYEPFLLSTVDIYNFSIVVGIIKPI